MKVYLAFVILLFPAVLQADVTNINAHQLNEMIEQDVVIIDVRTPGEWQQTGIVEGSIPIMFFNERNQPLADEWLAQAAEHAAKDQTLILICRTGNRSGVIANYLVKVQGYQDVINVQGGIVSWKRAGFKTVKP